MEASDMKRLIAAVGVLLCLGISPAIAQTYKLCGTAATSGNASCIGVPDTSGTVQENLPSTAGTTGQLKQATGSGNTTWGNQSANSLTYLSCGTPTFSAVSTGTTETVIGYCQVPGGLMSANGVLRITYTVARSGSGNDNVSLRIGAVNTTSAALCDGPNATGSTSAGTSRVAYMANISSVSANSCPTQPTNVINVNTASPFYIVFTGTPATSGDTLTGVSLAVEYLSATPGGQ
jgi:hypothetical protein